MKEIKTYVRPLVANRIVKNLEEAGAKDLTLIRVDAIRSLPYQKREDEATFAKCVTRCCAAPPGAPGTGNHGLAGRSPWRGRNSFYVAAFHFIAANFWSCAMLSNERP